MKITKKQVKAIDKGELTVRELFPDVFEVKRESGWRKIDDCHNRKWLMYYDLENKEFYGFDWKGEWCEKAKITWETINKLEYKATPEEVETALINEAKRRYNEGDIIVPFNSCFLDNAKEMTITKNEFFMGICQIEDSYDYSAIWVGTGVYNSTVFMNGTWAEIITQPEPIEMTVAEIEQKLNINNLKIVKQ